MEPEMNLGMKTSTVAVALVAVLVLLGGWYWMSGTKSTNAPSVSAPAQTGTQATTTPPAAVFTISSDAKLGKYLAAPSGMTLYTYSKDTKGVSNCSGTCAGSWPPYTIAAGALPFIPAGLTGSIGSITRADGTLQVTYKGMPLYFWVSDAKAGDITGDNVGGFLLAKP